MIQEDEMGFSLFERGSEFDCNCAHKNWLLGLIVGLKSELYQYQHEDLYNAAVSELFQDKLLRADGILQESHG